MFALMRIICICAKWEEKLVIFSERLDNFATLEELMLTARPPTVPLLFSARLRGSVQLCLATSIHVSASAEKQANGMFADPMHEASLAVR